VGIGHEKFYTTSYHYFTNPTMQSVEVMLGLRLGSVLYFDGKNTTYVHRWMGSPTGIALDKNKKCVSDTIGSNVQKSIILSDTYMCHPLPKATFTFSSLKRTAI
jgi:hypothetical protein